MAKVYFYCLLMLPINPLFMWTNFYAKYLIKIKNITNNTYLSVSLINIVFGYGHHTFLNSK